MQSPSNAQVVPLLIDDYKGLNDQQDSISRPRGTSTSGRNVFDEQAGLANRRAGRDMVSLDSGGNPVNIILNLQWDNGGVTNLSLAGGTFSYDDFTYPNTGNLSDKITDPASPGPMPTAPKFLPIWKTYTNQELPDLVSYMRALSEARAFVHSGVDDIVWPTSTWSIDFYDDDENQVALHIYDKTTVLYYLNAGYLPVRTQSYAARSPSSPMTDTEDNFYWIDYFCNPGLWVTHLNSLITYYNTLILTNYLKTWPIEEQVTLSNYGGSDIFNVVPDFSNFKETALQFAGLIQSRLVRVQVQGALADDHMLKEVFDSTYAGAVTAFNLASYAPTSGDMIGKWMWYKDNPLYTLYEATGRLYCDLSSYPASLSILSAECFAKFNQNWFPNSNPPAKILWNISLNPLFFKWAKLANQIPILGGPWYTDYLTDDVAPELGITYQNGLYSGWYIALGQGNDSEKVRVILTRNPQYKPMVPATGFADWQIITPDEYFTFVDSQDTSGETSISWNMVKLTASGGASRTYPQTTTNNPVSMTAATSILYDGSADGFVATRFVDYYRPCILLMLDLACSQKTATVSSITVKLYINSTLAATTVLSGSTGGKVAWAFAVKGVGNWGSTKPPHNNSADNYDGWDSPSVRITIQPDAGVLTINGATKLIDYVVNYPFG